MSHYKKDTHNSGHRRAHGEHALMSSGAAFAHPKCMEGDCLVFIREQTSPPGSVGGDGHALCICGARSEEHLPNLRARIAWRDKHKAEMAAPQEDTAA